MKYNFSLTSNTDFVSLHQNVWQPMSSIGFRVETFACFSRNDTSTPLPDWWPQAYHFFEDFPGPSRLHVVCRCLGLQAAGDMPLATIMRTGSLCTRGPTCCGGGRFAFQPWIPSVLGSERFD